MPALPKHEAPVSVPVHRKNPITRFQLAMLHRTKTWPMVALWSKTLWMHPVHTQLALILEWFFLRSRLLEKHFANQSLQLDFVLGALHVLHSLLQACISWPLTVKQIFCCVAYKGKRKHTISRLPFFCCNLHQKERKTKNSTKTSQKNSPKHSPRGFFAHMEAIFHIQGLWHCLRHRRGRSSRSPGSCHEPRSVPRSPTWGGRVTGVRVVQ